MALAAVAEAVASVSLTVLIYVDFAVPVVTMEVAMVMTKTKTTDAGGTFLGKQRELVDGTSCGNTNIQLDWTSNTSRLKTSEKNVRATTFRDHRWIALGKENPDLL